MEGYKDLPSRNTKLTRAIHKKFITNYFSIDMHSDKNIFCQYSVQIDPPIENDSTRKIQKIIDNVKNTLKQRIGYVASRGNIAYGTKNENSSIIIQSKMKHDGIQKAYYILLRKTNDIPVKDMLYSHKENQKSMAIQVININTKERLKALDMMDVGKGRFYHKLKIIKEIFNNGFFVMRGYKYTSCHLKMGICLQVDIFSRLIRQANMLEQINQLRNKKLPIEQLQGSIAIARYGNFRTYQIIKIDHDKSPMTTFTPHNRSQQITYADYYKQQYDIDVTIKNQPLILSASKIEKIKNKQQKMEKIYHYIYLIPEFMSLVGLSDSQRSSGNLMKDLAQRTKISPKERMNNILKSIQNLNNTSGMFKVNKPLVLDGYELNQPTYSTGSGNFEAINGKMKIQNKGVKQKGLLSDWFLFYHFDHSEQAQQLQQSILFSANSLGIVVKEPEHIKQDKISPINWMESIQEQINYSKQNNLALPSIIMIIVGGIIKDEVYNEVKSLCTLKLQIPTQFVHVKKIINLQKKNNLLSYSSNLLLQMHAKIGKTIWSIPIKSPDLKKKVVMLGGMSLSKYAKKRSLAFVGTINKQLTKVYNETKTLTHCQDVPQILQGIFGNWIKSFYQHNNKDCLPDVIIFYREGIGKSQLSRNSQKQIASLKSIIQLAQSKTKFKKYNPQIIYITVNRQSTTRFYENRGQFCNPRPGSVLIDEMTDSKFFNFHLAPHYVQDYITSSPTHFIVCHHEPKRISNQAIVQITYEQCFNYYNWKGSIKFPACLQNADRLAKLSTKSLKTDIKSQNIMSRSYHFL